MKKLLEKVSHTHELERDEIIKLLKNNLINEDLYSCADKVRKEFVGDKVKLYGLLEFSNVCQNNCCYCGLRRANSNISRYRLGDEEIGNLVKYAVQCLKLKTIVMQSGEDVTFCQDKMCRLISEIKQFGADLILSNGAKTPEEYRAYKEAGAYGFLMRIETTDKKLYDGLHPDDLFEKREKCICSLGEVGLKIGTGSLVGLPGQTVESIADDILFFKKTNPALVGIGPFIPHQGTPLRGAFGGTLQWALKVTALTRLLLPHVDIPATTAMGALEKGGQEKALQAGANVIMPNITFTQEQKNYDLFPGKTTVNFSEDSTLSAVYEMIKKIGRKY